MPYADREKQLAFQREDKHRQRLARKAVLFEGAKCMDCGNDDPRVLDFHHRDPKDKKLNVSQSWSYRWETVQAERDKCDILCANCHRIRHASGL
jgi:hypothetical protein